MFYYLSQLPEQLADQGHAGWADLLSGLRVFQYITFRSASAAILAMKAEPNGFYFFYRTQEVLEPRTQNP